MTFVQAKQIILFREMKMFVGHTFIPKEYYGYMYKHDFRYLHMSGDSPFILASYTKTSAIYHHDAKKEEWLIISSP